MKLHGLVALFALFTSPLLAQEMPKPGPEHQKLHAHVGTWDATIESMGPDGSVEQSKGVSEMTMGLGGFWLQDHFQGEFGGMKFEGRGLTGFDPMQGKYVGNWADSFSPVQLVLEGGFDKDGKVLTMTGMGMGMDGKPAMHRMVTTLVDASTMKFEMYMATPEGKEMKMLTITYQKRVAKPAK
jgi:hypothetical protein